MHLPAAPTAVRMEPAALPAAFAPQCESWLLHSPPQCECTCLLPSLDLLRQTVAPRPRQPSLRDQGSHRSANGAAALAAAVRPQCECTCLLPPPQCEWSRRRSATKAATAVRMERLNSPPQCGRSANAPACCPHRSANGARRTARCLCAAVRLPSLDLLRQTAAAATKAAAAVRVHLPAALARPAQTDRSCRNQGSRRSANEAGCCPRRCSANAPACCPRSTCSDRPQPLQCECTCLLPLLDLLRQTAAAATKAAAAVRMHLPAALARPAQTDRRR